MKINFNGGIIFPAKNLTTLKEKDFSTTYEASRKADIYIYDKNKIGFWFKNSNKSVNSPEKNSKAC